VDLAIANVIKATLKMLMMMVMAKISFKIIVSEP